MNDNVGNFSDILDKIVTSLSHEKPGMNLVPYYKVLNPPYAINAHSQIFENFSQSLIAFNNSEEEIQIRVLLPLINRQSIKISLEDSVRLSVKAEYFDIFANQSETFEHSGNIPKGYPIDRTQKVRASYTDGVLTISIPLVPKEIVEISLDDWNN